jgi:hypothetical protein
MKFQSKYTNAVYIVRPTTRIFYPEMGYSQLKPGLAAKFQGPQRIFDSVKTQEMLGWSDEERNLIEDHLLKHRDWGVGLYLAPGEVLPEGKEAAVRVKTPVQVRRCSQLTVIDGDIRQCPEQASVGREFCKDHDPDAPKITQGTVGGSGKVG